MDHDLVVRQKLTESYLLGELDPQMRDQFEEHFFDCPECALDVHAGALFVERSKTVLAENPVNSSTISPQPHPTLPKPGWLAWFRPAIVMPVLALLLTVIGYQNLVSYPRLEQARNNPQLLPWTQVNVGTYGSETPAVQKRPHDGFLLFIRIPPDRDYSHYTADLYNSDGKLDSSLTIPASTQDQWPVQIPAANRKAGTYTLAVHGISAEGKSTEVGRASFELQIQSESK
jgi:Putative zinc-finger